MKFIKSKLLLISVFFAVPIILAASLLITSNSNNYKNQNLLNHFSSALPKSLKDDSLDNSIKQNNAKITEILKDFNNSPIEFKKTIDLGIKFLAKVSFASISVTNLNGTVATIENLNDIKLPIDIQIDNNNNVILSTKIIPTPTAKYDMMTGEGSTGGVSIPKNFLTDFWGDESPFIWNPSIVLETINIPARSHEIKLDNYPFKIDKYISDNYKNISKSNMPLETSRVLFTHTLIIPTGAVPILSSAFLGITKPQNSDNVFDINSFSNQILYKFDKNQIFNYVNAWIDTVNQENKLLLKNGANNQSWNYGDVTNKKMPTLFNFNSNLLTLFEIEKINNLIKNCIQWLNLSSSSSGWAPAIDIFLQSVINNYKFESVEELQGIYSKFTQLSSNGQNQTGLTEFKQIASDMISSNKNYETKINVLKNYLKLKNINIPTASNEFINSYNSKYCDLSILSILTKGFLVSNDIIADVSVDYIDASTNKKMVYNSPDVILYSSNSNEINSTFLREVLTSSAKEEVVDGHTQTMQTLSVKNVRISNRLEKKFLNISTTNIDSDKFNVLNQLKKIEINYKADAMNFSNFAYAEWTKNKDAIGININKYLSEIIHLNNIDNNNINDLTEGSKIIILKALNGEYSYMNEKYEKITPERPIFLDSTNILYKDTPSNFLTSVEGGVGINDIDNFFNQTAIDKNDWIQAWKYFNIPLDQSDTYPLYAPNNETQEFFIIGSVRNFYSNSNYENIKKGLINNSFNNVKPLTLINKKPISTTNYDGYFLLKIKTCLNNNFNLKPNSLRKYNIKDNDLNGTLNNFIKNVLFKMDEQNKPVYWIAKKTDTTNDSFFETEKWSSTTWDLNYNKIWYDLLVNPDIRIISTQQREKANSFITNQVQNDFVFEMQEQYGKESVFVKELNQNIIINNALFNLQNSLIDEKTFINGIPYVFSQDIWNNLAKFLEYQNLFADQLVNKDKIEQNVFHKFLQQNEIDSTSRFSNELIMSMFNNLDYIKSSLLTPKSNTNDYTILKNGALIDEFIIQFNKFKSNFNSSSPPSGGADYQNWLTDINIYLKNFDLPTVYSNEFKAVFSNIFGDKYLNKIINNITFVGNDNINQNFLFSTLEELIQDEMIQKIFSFYDLKNEDIFEIKPLTINDSIVDNQCTYEIKKDIILPFSISQIYINGTTYFSLTNDNNNFILAAPIAFLNEIANISYVDKSNRLVYKVLSDNKPLIDILQSTNQNLKQLNSAIISDENHKENYEKTINIGAIVLVTVLPVVVILIIFLTIWLTKAKKRKMKF